jgi:hypothetical protein
MVESSSGIMKATNYSCESYLFIISIFKRLLVLPFNNLELLPQIVLNNTVIIDKSMNWSLLLYKGALRIHRQKPELNHGTKSSKELVIFN